MTKRATHLYKYVTLLFNYFGGGQSPAPLPVLGPSPLGPVPSLRGIINLLTLFCETFILEKVPCIEFNIYSYSIFFDFLV